MFLIKQDVILLIWNGTCHVHEEFSLEAIIKLKKENPDAKIIVHPECELPVRMVADFIGSTSALLAIYKKRQWKLLYCSYRSRNNSSDEKRKSWIKLIFLLHQEIQHAVAVNAVL